MRFFNRVLPSKPDKKFLLKKRLFFIALSLLIVFFLIGPVRFFFEYHREDIFSKKEVVSSEKNSLIDFSYGKVKKHILSKISGHFDSARGTHPFYGLPFHKLIVDIDQQPIAKDKRVSPKDTAFFLLYFLQRVKAEKEPEKVLAIIERSLQNLVSFSKKFPDFAGLFPESRLTYEKGLEPINSVVSMLDNSYLTWVLASIETYFKSSVVKKYSEIKKDILMLVDFMLKNQNYSIFYDEDQKGFLKKISIYETFFKQKTYAGSALESDVLGPLWAILHDQIPKKDITEVWDNLKVFFSLSPDSKGNFCKVPLTKYGNFADLMPHIVFLPNEDTEMSFLVQNALFSHFTFSSKKGCPALAGPFISQQGHSFYSGDKSLALHPDEIKNDFPSLVSTSLAYMFDPIIFQPWLSQMYGLLWPERILSSYELALVGASCYGSVKGLVKGYLRGNKKWKKYKELWFQKKEKDFADKEDCKVFTLPERRVGPYWKKRIQGKSKWGVQSKFDILGMSKDVTLDKGHFGDVVSIKKNPGYLEIEYDLQKSMEVHLEIDQAIISPAFFESLEMNYEVISDNDLEVSLEFRQGPIVLARTKGKKLLKDFFKDKGFKKQGSKSSWKRTFYSLSHPHYFSQERVSTLVIRLEGTESYAKSISGKLTIRNIELNPVSQLKESFFQEKEKTKPTYDSKELLNWPGIKMTWGDWKVFGQMEPQGSFSYPNGGFGYFHRVGDLQDISGITMKPTPKKIGQQNSLLKGEGGEKKEEQECKGLGLRIQEGLYGKLPKYFQVEAKIHKENRVEKMSWNIDISNKGAEKYIILPLPNTFLQEDFLEMTTQIDSYFNKGDNYSWMVDEVRLLTEEQMRETPFKNEKDFSIYNHEKNIPDNIMRLIVAKSESPTWKYVDDAYVFPESFGPQHIFEMVLYPEKRLNGSELLIEGSDKNFPDGFFRLKLYCNRDLLLDKDIFLSQGLDNKDVRILLSHDTRGKTINRIEISNVVGFVRIKEMKLKD